MVYIRRKVPCVCGSPDANRRVAEAPFHAFDLLYGVQQVHLNATCPYHHWSWVVEVPVPSIVGKNYSRFQIRERA
jgi:hypothetical protein